MMIHSRRALCARHFLFAVGAGLASLAAAPGSAAIIETSTITNSYRYIIGTETGSSDNAGPTAFISATNTDPRNGNISEGALQLTSYLDADGGFYFLHNSFCHGGCDISITTEIVFTLQNTGTEAVNLRFDSQITPGHVARNNSTGQGDSSGLFTFTVDQDVGAPASNRLFEAYGYTGLNTGVDTSDDSVFNGFNTQIPGDGSFAVSDWSATNLNLQLATLAAGATTTVRYRSTLQVLNNSDCRDGLLAATCAGFQVAFGDPRNKGTTEDIREFGASADGDSPLPAVGAVYDPYRFTASFVPVGSPLPGTPSVIPPIPYNTGYVPLGGAVPEPATWAMMIAGFGLVGGRLRARQGRNAPVTA